MNQVDKVVAMSYYSGAMPGTDGKDAHTLHVCLDHLEDGRIIPTLRASSPMGGIVARSARCVDGLIWLHGRACSPEDYILQWRTVQAIGAQTLTAWLQVYEVKTTVNLPDPGIPAQTWVPPAYFAARARLFRQAVGRSSAQLHTPLDIRDAVLVMQGLAAFDGPRTSLTETLTVSPNRSLALAA
ncbi:hypothetical protein RQP54_17880 [Curvibacter sp. APW13]|uniref:hypothetical protein n=1 Tax=Curvibacter sp. APW13 TaxID=3077236 RepID=UPI0028DEDC95|nr:hypothetical protein [Curvibacter sp. APW13]MDT8992747.1 hypothetical protein [Curvibacter sp. APW13]